MAEQDNQGEYVELPDEDSDVEDTEDGGALVTLDTSTPPGQTGFYANLAESTPSWELSNLGNALTFFIYGVFGLLGLIIVLILLPETKGRSLEELELILLKKTKTHTNQQP